MAFVVFSRTKLAISLGALVCGTFVAVEIIMALWPRTRPLLASLPLALFGSTTTATAQTVDVSWHPPAQSEVNRDFTQVLHDKGTYGFIYDTSKTPDDQYGTYNWCNMPHVRAREYVRPSEEYELRYVEVIHRHHKRTPYASNAFPVEPYRWDCDDQGLFYYGERLGDPDSGEEAARTYWKVYTSPVNPFMPSGWIGTCQFPQITAEGLDDSYAHGADLYEVYHDLLGFLPDRDQGGESNGEGFAENDWDSKVKYRVTNNQITSQVAGLLIKGMWGTTSRVGLDVQAAGVDSLEPQYECPRASSLFNSIRSGDDGSAWAEHLRTAAPLFDQLDRISGVDTDDGHFHASFDPYYDNLSARECHDKPLPCEQVADEDGTGSSRCVTREMADAVYRIGHWEYSHIYRDSEDSLAASAASLGVWVAELAAHLRRAIEGGAGNDGGNEPIYRHNVAHDGSVSRLLAILQLREMVWPGMGAEVVFELYEKKDASSDSSTTGSASFTSPSSSPSVGGRMAESAPKRESGWFVRALFGGRVLESSSPALGTMNMVPVETLLAYFDGLVGENASRVKENCRNN